MTAADKIAEAKALSAEMKLWNSCWPGNIDIEETWGRAEDMLAALADLADAQAQEIERLRAENERLRNMALLARFSEVFAGSHRHLKSGGLYDHLGTGRIQSDQPLTDMDEVEIYIGVNGDLWARRQAEFHDGRFAEISPTLGETP